uniref:GyrI-like small molecule binding domain-containing protein n=1 Tax=Strombidinopsis acuminata TaxID=141414 RepID=A0A7S3RYH5_9SPIT|mmetsp:Transcript_15772/g.21373  ORF Transcript_15772/g.21373 Transcript_15772/m.21373 type:complete len:204 (+) Transcript_15772:43-654(+)
MLVFDTTIELVLLALFAIWYIGLFSMIRGVTVYERKWVGGTLYYKPYSGNYNDIGPVYEKAWADMNSYVETEPKKFPMPLVGIYYDDAKKTNSRAVVGFLARHAVTEEQTKHFTSMGYMVKELPKAKSIFASHSIPNRWGIFYGIAAAKVYPKLFARAAEKYGSTKKDGHYAVEMHPIYRAEVDYYVPVENGSDFFLFDKKQN